MKLATDFINEANNDFNILITKNAWLDIINHRAYSSVVDLIQRRFDLANINSVELVRKYLANKVYAVKHTSYDTYMLTFKINGELDNFTEINKFELSADTFNKFIESKAINVTTKQPDNVVVPKNNVNEILALAKSNTKLKNVGVYTATANTAYYKKGDSVSIFSQFGSMGNRYEVTNYTAKTTNVYWDADDILKHLTESKPAVKLGDLVVVGIKHNENGSKVPNVVTVDTLRVDYGRIFITGTYSGYALDQVDCTYKEYLAAEKQLTK